MTETAQRTIADRYLQFWNAPTADDQLTLVSTTFTEEVVQRSAIGVRTGGRGLVDFKTELTDRVGPVSFVARHQPDQHHDRIRLAWDVVLADGSSFATGTDVLEVAEDGRIAAITSFLDRAPEGFGHDHA